MVNHKVQMSENGMYEIIETLTNNKVAQNLDIHQAKASCRHLNFGGGFDGWVPDFFTNKLEISV